MSGITNGITTHILDTSRGEPAPGVAVRLEFQRGDEWQLLAQSVTDADGRARLAGADGWLLAGVYRLSFEVETYFEARQIETFYPLVQILFRAGERGHYHVPLLLSAFGYSTYRGS